MMVERVERPNTLIVTIPEELSNVSHTEIVDMLVASLGEEVIQCIQFVPKCYARVTFSSFDARNNAFFSGIYAGPTRLFAVEADPVFKDVYLEHLPAEVSDDAVTQALGPFGAVHDIHHLKFAGSSIFNDTRLIRMAMASDIPVNLRILRYPCRVFYKGQPRPCAICRSSDHRAPDCPLRDVCRVCRLPGHFARACPGIVPAPPPAEDPVSHEEEDLVDDDVPDVDAVDVDDDDVDVESEVDDVPEDDDDDTDYLEDDDIENDDDEDLFVSGDDEVIQAAQVLPPGSSRSSSDVPEPVPMFTADLIFVDRPTWLKRAPEWIVTALSGHTSNTHFSFEQYSTGETCYVAFDCGDLTYRFFKDAYFPDELRYDQYISDFVSHPRMSAFGVAAMDLPPLSPDVVPTPFPARR